jgi:hypothetical protein
MLHPNEFVERGSAMAGVKLLGMPEIGLLSLRRFVARGVAVREINIRLLHGANGEYDVRTLTLY